MAVPHSESVNADVLAVLEAHGKVLEAHGKALEAQRKTINTLLRAVQTLDAKMDRRFDEMRDLILSLKS